MKGAGYDFETEPGPEPACLRNLYLQINRPDATMRIVYLNLADAKT